MKTFNKLTKDQILSLRYSRQAAYRAGQYKFSAPPVYSGNWSDEAWMNHVQFDNPNLTGFLPYTK